MSETKFTPGPWKTGRLLATAATRTWTEEQRLDGDAKERLRVFANFMASDKGRSRVGIAECRKEANAHLIAAAPSMYEALEYVLKTLRREVEAGHSSILIAEGALAKARGKGS